MKKTLITAGLLFFAAASFMACSSNEKSESTEVAQLESITADVDIDTAASTVVWQGDMLNMYSHEGNVTLKSGHLNVENNVVKSGNFVVDMATIVPTDKGYDAENTPEKLVGHLSAPDFFNIAEYPTATFEVTSSAGDVVNGNLTVRGVTNPESVKNAMIMEENGKTVATGTLTFDRTKYGVNFSMPAGDKVLSNDITLKIRLVSK